MIEIKVNTGAKMRLSKKPALLIVIVCIAVYFVWAQFDRGNSKNTGRDLPNSLAPINAKAIGLTTNSKSVMKAKTSPDVLIDPNRIPPSFWATYGQRADFKKIYDENRNSVSSDREAAYFLHGILRSCAQITFGGKDKARERLLMGKFSHDIENMRRATFERALINWAKRGFASDV